MNHRVQSDLIVHWEVSIQLRLVFKLILRRQSLIG